MDMNNLQPDEAAMFADNQYICGDCRKPADWCECITCWVCQEHIKDDDAREVMPSGSLVHTDDCHGRAVRMAERDARAERGGLAPWRCL